jgi:TolB-like protein/Tfp pilus assembly protein PilF
MSARIGQTLGHYTILSKLGEGGMGIVYRAHDERLDREVAIKVLPDEVAQDKERLARFEREARIVAKLDHPNILCIHDYCSRQGVTYAVTELLEGQTLRQRIPENGAGWQVAVEIGAAVAEGLAAAHAKDVIHRDLKPENIFISSDGRPKILDFGLAHVKHQAEEDSVTVSVTPAETAAGTVLGTLGYMAPEQVRGQPTDARSDIFALGAVLYEMISGQRAFARATGADTQAAILKDEPPSLSDAGVSLPTELERTIRRCLEKSPDARFQSASDLAYALRAMSTGSPSTEATRSAPGWTTKLSQPVALTIVIAVVAVVAGVVGWLATRPSAAPETRPIRRIAVLPLENLSGDPDRDFYADGMTEALTTELGTISALTVVSSRSSMLFKGSDMPIEEVARVLDVDALVSGSVLTSGNRVRIAAQLIDPADQRVIWSRAYENDRTDTVTLLGEMARAISREIRVAVTPDEEKRLGRTRQVVSGAQEQYLLGRHLMYSEGDMGAVLAHLERAVEIDPSFAEAWAFMAQVITEMAGDGQIELTEARRRAGEALDRALELDPEIAEVYAVLGTLTADEPSLRRSVELNPSSAFAQLELGIHLVGAGKHDEGFDRLQTALRLDPVSFRTRAWVAGAYHYVGQFDTSIALLEQVQEVNPLSRPNQFISIFLGLNYAAKGRYDEAVESCIQAGDSELCGLVYAVAGRKDLAETTLAWMMTNPNIGPCYVAGVHAGLGETDQAMAWIGKAIQQNHPWLRFCFMPLVRGLMADDPRYQETLRQMAPGDEED